MYIALYTPDHLGRQLLVGWDNFTTQEFGNPVIDRLNTFYSNFLSPRVVPYGDTTYEITSVGLLPLEPSELEPTTELSAAKDNKITLINQQFEKMTEQVAPGGYLVYLYALSLLQDVDTDGIFNWLGQVNKERDKTINEINAVESVGELGRITADLGSLEFERPVLPTFSSVDQHNTFSRTSASSYDKEVEIESMSEIELYMKTDKLPLHGFVVTNSPDKMTTVWTNHKDKVVQVNPTSILFRLNDGTAMSASSVLTETTELPEDFKQLEFTVNTEIRLSTLNLTLSTEGDTATVETTCGSTVLTGKNLNFSVECSSATTVITTDSTEMGPLNIQGTELSTNIVKHSAVLVEGSLALELNGESVEYSVYDEDGQQLYNGTESVEELFVGTGYVLECLFSESVSPSLIYWTIDPEEKIRESYMVRTRYSNRENKLTVLNDTSQKLVGELVLIHRATPVNLL